MVASQTRRQVEGGQGTGAGQEAAASAGAALHKSI